MTYTFEQYWSAFHHKYHGIPKETAKTLFSHGQLIMLEHLAALEPSNRSQPDVVQFLAAKCNLALPDPAKVKPVEAKPSELRPKTQVAMDLCQILEKAKASKPEDFINLVYSFLLALDQSKSKAAMIAAQQIANLQVKAPVSPTVLEQTRLTICQFLGVNAWI